MRASEYAYFISPTMREREKERKRERKREREREREKCTVSPLEIIIKPHVCERLLFAFLLNGRATMRTRRAGKDIRIEYIR